MTLANLLDSMSWDGLRSDSHSLEGDGPSTPPASAAQPAPAPTNPVTILCELRRLGVEPGLSREGAPVLTGVSVLDPDARAQVLDLAREHRAAIVATLTRAEQAFATIKFSVEQGLLSVWRHPDGAIFPDLNAVEARFGFDARRIAGLWWDTSWPVLGRLVAELGVAEPPAARTPRTEPALEQESRLCRDCPDFKAEVEPQTGQLCPAALGSCAKLPAGPAGWTRGGWRCKCKPPLAPLAAGKGAIQDA